jgi:DUF1680 family protein
MLRADMKLSSFLIRNAFLGAILLLPHCGAFAVEPKGALACESIPAARFHFDGVIGARVEANIDGWLLRAPGANPGMLEMFRVRDRQPVPALVPWAGEFAGKYLISCVEALRMSERPELRAHVEKFVADLIATQAEDGYLGPFPKARRLRGDWDLWGHYHVMQGLLAWHEQTGDEAAMRAVRRAADLICATYLDGSLRVANAGSEEMNMAVIHVMTALHRLTGEPRYLQLAHEIEKDWEKAGDYLRAGLDGREYYASPRPRWESLHDLQGLAELWRVTGEEKYRESFEHHWRSIARFDVHNTGSFTAGEQATGNPWANGAIETCCTVAWMALSLDMLRLTADARVADALEISTLNGALGAQHPTGQWWTYSTPMDGVRESSAHSIVFQARAGTPELNCCSVNGPRSLGMLADWAVMSGGDGLYVNAHFPGEIMTPLAKLTCATEYPRDGAVKWIVEPKVADEFALRWRIPAWSLKTRARLNGAELAVKPGSYLEIKRVWKSGDAMDLDLDLSLAVEPGDREQLGKVSIFRGPLLLAWDQKQNAFDEAEIPPIDFAELANAKVVKPENPGVLAPWLLVELPGGLRLSDFASAGAAGTHYRSWLPTAEALPPPPITRAPLDGAAVGAGRVLFKWTTKPGAALTSYHVAISTSADFANPAAEFDAVSPQAEFDTRDLAIGPTYYWRVVARGPYGQTHSAEPPARFRVDPAKPIVAPAGSRPDGVFIRAALRGDAKPEIGELVQPPAFTPAGDAVRLNGENQRLVYALPEELGEDFTVSVWVRVHALPKDRIAHIFSAWAAPSDDPLRLTFDKGKLFARVETQNGGSTKGVPFELDRWQHVAAVKAGPQLTIYVDGAPAETLPVPTVFHTSARNCALGGNPNFTGNEYLDADFASFEFLTRALSGEEIRGLRQADKR